MFEVNDNQYTKNYNCVIIPENGSSFREGKRLRFNLDNTSGFIDPESSFLRFDLNRSGNGAGGSVPEPTSGGHSLIRDLLIYSGDGTNLEELLDYNVWVNQEINLSNDKGYKETRNNIEGCILQDEDSDDSLEQQDILDNKYSKYNDGVYPISKKICLPLYGGLFKSGKVVPITALNGLRIDIQLDDNVNRCMRGSTELVREFDVEDINLAGASSRYLVIKVASLDPSKVESGLGWGVGDMISFDGNNYKVKKIGVGKSNTIPPYVGTVDQVIVSLEVNELPRKNYQNQKIKWYDDNSLSYEVSNPVLVVRKVIPQPQYLNSMIKKLSGKGLSFDIKSFNNIKNSVSADALQSSTLINSFHTRALSLCSVPQSQSNNNLEDNLLRGVNLNANNYVYNIKNKQVPSRKVNLTRYNIDTSANTVLDRNISNDVEHISETDKAWRNAGVVVRNLRNQQYNISYDRALSNYGGSMNLMGANPQLQINYTTGGGAKLINTFVSHLKNININPATGVVVSS
tara:strand:+ start:323 stop:1867 length:1545 start_codon:yes stop_codon:yes gene_type:complete